MQPSEVFFQLKVSELGHLDSALIIVTN
jgi:hypothetical protein